MLYHPTKFQGFIYEKLRVKNRSGGGKRKVKYNQIATIDSNQNETDSTQEEYATQDINAAVNMFKNAVLPGDLEIVRDKLKQTVNMRKFLFKENEKSMFESILELYLFESNLVSLTCNTLFDFGDFYHKQCFFVQIDFDFRISFENWDATALIRLWAGIEHLFGQTEMLPENLDVDDDQLRNLLLFVKMFPAHRSKFEKSLEAFIVFCDVNIKKCSLL